MAQAMTDRAMRHQGWIGVVLCVFISACAQVRFEGAEARVEVFPADISDAERWVGEVVVWGGRIIETANLEEGSELLVLGLPLTSGNVPKIEEQSVGRFIVRTGQFIEPLDFSPGRYVTLKGRLSGLSSDWSRSGQAFELPVVLEDGLHLWSRDLSSWKSRVSIGIGIGIHN